VSAAWASCKQVEYVRSLPRTECHHTVSLDRFLRCQGGNSHCPLQSGNGRGRHPGGGEWSFLY
jgi:hypothetical protein